jgi:hypothetical protein
MKDGLIECGICGAYHRKGYTGDCRNDAERFPTNELTVKHTPGPWRVNNNIGKKSEIGVTADEAPCIIAIMGNQRTWPLEAKANARLIASAPEMLTMLKELIAQIDYSFDIMPLGCIGKKAIREAKEVIAKAEGVNHG